MVAQLTEYSKLLHHSSPSKLCEWRYMTCTIPRKRAPEEADMPTSNYWPSAPTAVVAQLTEFSNLLSHSSPSCARGGTLVLLLALPPLKVSRSDHPTPPAMRRSWHHRRLAALAHDQLPKKHIATSTAVQRRSVNQGNAVNTTCKLLRCPPSTERATQTTQSRSQHRSWRRERRTVVGSPSNFASKLAHVVGVAFR